MPKKSKKTEKRLFRKLTLNENCERKSKLITVSEQFFETWCYLKGKLKFKTDFELLEFLLETAKRNLSCKNEISDPPTPPAKVEETKEAHASPSEEAPETSKSIAEKENHEETQPNCDKKVGRNKKPKKKKHVQEKSPNKTSSVTIQKIEDLSDVEDFSFDLDSCQICRGKHTSVDCPLKSPLKIFSDSPPNQSKASGAQSTLPKFLFLKPIDSKHGESVFTNEQVPKYSRFGPLTGVPIKEMEITDDSSMKHIWEIEEGKYVSTEDPSKSNWLRFIRPAPTRELRNLIPIGVKGDLYFITTAVIRRGDELLYWAETSGAWATKNMDKTSCGGCNLQFEHSMYYRVHCAVFHEASLSLTVRKYHCKVCGEQVLGKQNIMKHAELFHDGKGAYQCQFCSKFFLRLNYLEMHRNYGCSANPHRARPLCDYCGRKFCQPQKLKVHIKRMHSDLAEVLKEFQCSECLKVLGSRAALQRHNKEVHKRPSSAQCSKCAKTFQNKSNLKIHMLTHSGVKPFKCEEGSCNAAFTTKQCLQFHYRKVHGLNEGQIPMIVRSVEYTFNAYAGEKSRAGRVCEEIDVSQGSSQNSTDNIQPGDLGEMTGRDQLVPPLSQERSSPIECPPKTLVSKASKKWMGDTCIEVDESDKESEKEAPIPFCRTEQSNASLLVEAALESAERDIDISKRIEDHPEEFREYQPEYCPQEEGPRSPPEPYHLSPRHYGERSQYEMRISPDYTLHEDFRYDFHRRLEETSNDEPVVQNLSVIKSKPDYFEERAFESDRYHSSFVSVTPRYTSLYEAQYAHSDVLRVVSLAHSVDLSLSRPHQILHPSPVTPAPQLDPTSYQSPYSLTASYLPPKSHSPTYHPYSGYY